MPSFYLNSYAPLATTKPGREASATLGIDPFVDGSIRREPDLEHVYPAISCLCRADKFAPRLAKDDIVAYVLRKDRYGQKLPHRRLTAILRVLEILPSHTQGAMWYQQRGLNLPNNCWVHGNPAKPFEQSHRQHKISNAVGPDETHHHWDVGYKARARKYGTFVVCEKLYCELTWSAPEVSDEQLVSAFGKVLSTQNPSVESISCAEQFFALMGIDVRLSRQ